MNLKPFRSAWDTNYERQTCIISGEANRNPAWRRVNFALAGESKDEQSEGLLRTSPGSVWHLRWRWAELKIVAKFNDGVDVQTIETQHSCFPAQLDKTDVASDDFRRSARRRTRGKRRSVPRPRWAHSIMLSNIEVDQSDFLIALSCVVERQKTRADTCGASCARSADAPQRPWKSLAAALCSSLSALLVLPSNLLTLSSKDATIATGVVGLHPARLRKVQGSRGRGKNGKIPVIL